ncbi:hypothetical protein WI41_10740 [Burkholderia latens]|uniref:Uncharacterized protein n=1 Tax=Burkholderia latens TaxID=488446 RepID=A0AAP1GBB7_9BURK|nr:hypothetical protein WI41_10740 [Burkholderia latens]
MRTISRARATACSRVKPGRLQVRRAAIAIDDGFAMQPLNTRVMCVTRCAPATGARGRQSLSETGRVTGSMS